MRPLTTDLAKGSLRPYFFWDEDTTVEELRAGLAGPDLEERLRLLGKMLREANDTDVWQFVTPAEVASALPMLGRHRPATQILGVPDRSLAGARVRPMIPHGRLTPMQDAVLRAFFASERDFFLSGGAALVGFHLQHRETTDLDLFTASAEAFERAKVVLPNALAAVGMTVVVKHDAPGFRRVVVRSREEELVVDLVRDIGPQHHEKTEIDGIVVDPIEEIFSNKLTTLVSRQELRDIVDVFELERRGLRVEGFLDEAREKDFPEPSTVA